MVSKGKNIKRCSVIERFLRFSFLFLFVYFSSSNGHPAFSHTINGTYKGLHSFGYFWGGQFFSSGHSYQNPFDAHSIPEEPENNGETDEEISNDDYNFSWIHSSAYACSTSSVVSIHFFRLLQSYKNQATLPLYVLFHSWKNFLS